MNPLDAIEAVCGFFQLLFEKPLLLLWLIVGVFVYVMFIQHEEIQIKHNRSKTELVLKFIRGGLKEVK